MLLTNSRHSRPMDSDKKYCKSFIGLVTRCCICLLQNRAEQK